MLEIITAILAIGPILLGCSIMIGWAFDRLHGGIWGYSYMTNDEYEEEVTLRGWRGERAQKKAMIKRYGKWLSKL